MPAKPLGEGRSKSRCSHSRESASRLLAPTHSGYCHDQPTHYRRANACLGSRHPNERRRPEPLEEVIEASLSEPRGRARATENVDSALKKAGVVRTRTSLQTTPGGMCCIQQPEVLDGRLGFSLLPREAPRPKKGRLWAAPGL